MPGAAEYWCAGQGASMPRFAGEPSARRPLLVQLSVLVYSCMQARAICSVFPEGLYGSERAEGLVGFRKQIGRIRSRARECASAPDTEGVREETCCLRGEATAE